MGTSAVREDHAAGVSTPAAQGGSHTTQQGSHQQQLLPPGEAAELQALRTRVKQLEDAEHTQQQQQAARIKELEAQLAGATATIHLLQAMESELSDTVRGRRGTCGLYPQVHGNKSTRDE